MADDPKHGGKRRYIWLLTGAGLAMLALTAMGVLTLEAQVRPGLQSPHPRLLEPLPIDWAAVADDYDPERGEQLSRLTGFELRHNDFDKAALPILMPGPSSSISTAGMTFSSVGDAYGMALPQDQLDSDVTIVITATRIVVDADPGTFTPADFETLNVGGTRVKALVEPTESGWTASFRRYGAIYSVDVDCGNTGAGSPCQDAGYIRRVTAGLSDVTLGKRGEDSLPDTLYTRDAPAHSSQWNQPARYSQRAPVRDWDRAGRRGRDAWGPVHSLYPKASPDEAETATNRSVSISRDALLANDEDPVGGELRIVRVSNPANGKVSYANGTAWFVPNKGFYGDAGFDYTIENEKNLTSTARVHIEVTGSPPPPPPPQQCLNADGFPTKCPARSPATSSPANPTRPNAAGSDLVEK